MMNVFTAILVLSLSVSADALACGYASGTSKIKVPVVSACAAAAVSAACMAMGMAAGGKIAPLLPAGWDRYLSFSVLAAFGLIKLYGSGGDASYCDTDHDRKLSVSEGLALGAAISADGLAAGFGYGADMLAVAVCSAFTFIFTSAALYFGAKCGRGASGGRTGNITAGLALIALAVQKLICG